MSTNKTKHIHKKTALITVNRCFFLCIFFQRDPILAKQLFSSLFAGILQEMEKQKPRGESGKIKEELRCNMNTFLSKSTQCFPPFIACVQVRPSETILICSDLESEITVAFIKMIKLIKLVPVLTTLIAFMVSQKKKKEKHLKQF